MSDSFQDTSSLRLPYSVTPYMESLSLDIYYLSLRLTPLVLESSSAVGLSSSRVKTACAPLSLINLASETPREFNNVLASQSQPSTCHQTPCGTGHSTGNLVSTIVAVSNAFSTSTFPGIHMQNTTSRIAAVSAEFASIIVLSISRASDEHLTSCSVNLYRTGPIMAHDITCSTLPKV